MKEKGLTIIIPAYNEKNSIILTGSRLILGVKSAINFSMHII
jgi:hypothetical protein